MQWFVTNWFWLVIGVAFVGMHLVGHGGHGGHGGGNRQRTEGGDPRESPVREATGTPGGHHH